MLYSGYPAAEKTVTAAGGPGNALNLSFMLLTHCAGNKTAALNAERPSPMLEGKQNTTQVTHAHTKKHTHLLDYLHCSFSDWTLKG